jgi:hypothetical protein
MIVAELLAPCWFLDRRSQTAATDSLSYENLSISTLTLLVCWSASQKRFRNDHCEVADLLGFSVCRDDQCRGVRFGRGAVQSRAYLIASSRAKEF